VISGLHLSKHETDREAYMEEYGLTPDELVAKDFRIIQSSRRGYFPHAKSDWIAAIKMVYKRERNITAKYLREKYPHLYDQGVWIFGGINRNSCTAIRGKHHPVTRSWSRAPGRCQLHPVR